MYADTLTMEKLAEKSMTGNTYEDVYVRDNFGDSGVIPSREIPYQSPDIIPYQNRLLNLDQARTSYNGPDLGLPIVQNGQNNIFIRAKNLKSSSTTGSVELYCTKASVLLLPNRWQPVFTVNGTKSVGFIGPSGSNLNTNDVAIGREAFAMTSLPSVIGDHYCFITVVKTPDHTVNIPQSFTSNDVFVAWVQQNPAVAWRNISYVGNNQIQIVSGVEFGNINPTVTSFCFSFTTPKDHNFPVQTKVAVQCTDSRCPINWFGIFPEPDDQGEQSVAFNHNVPANFQGPLIVTLTSPNGQAFPEGAKYVFKYEERKPASELSEFHLSIGRYKVRNYFDSVTGYSLNKEFLIQLGECWTYVVRR